MIAVCYEKSNKTLTIRRGRDVFHELADGSKQMEVIPDVLVKFEPVPQRDTEDVFEDPSFMPGGPTPRRGIARVAGVVGIEQAAEGAGMTPDELVFWMLHDPQYDTANGFVIRRDEGTKVLSLDDWVVELPEGPDSPKRWCRACEREIQSKGLATHLSTSKTHKASMDEYRSKLRQKVTQLGRSVKPSETVAYL
jgi:hypothetical protein